MKKPINLTPAEIEKSVHDLISFYDFSFFERGVSASLGLTFAVEQLAVSLGLVGEWLYVGDYDTADMLHELVAMMDAKARELQLNQWVPVFEHLPYAPETKN